MRSRSARWTWVALALLALAALAGCRGYGTTPVGRLLDDPTQFEGQVVRIAGTVGMSAGALGYGAYRVDDGTGTITVVSQGGGAPREGARVGVEGTFRSVYTLGTSSVAVILEQRRVLK
jgi:hypothetical protein